MLRVKRLRGSRSENKKMRQPVVSTVRACSRNSSLRDPGNRSGVAPLSLTTRADPLDQTTASSTGFRDAPSYCREARTCSRACGPREPKVLYFQDGREERKMTPFLSATA